MNAVKRLPKYIQRPCYHGGRQHSRMFSFRMNNDALRRHHRCEVRYFLSTSSEQREDIDTNSLIRDQGLSPQQIDKILSSDLRYRNQHIAVEQALDETERDEVRRKRMIYRSKQRGWLEVDILLGSWATKFVPGLSPRQLDEYELVLKEETIDIYNFVSGKDELPDRIKDLSVIKMLQEYAKSSKVNDPLSYERLKKETNLT